MQCRPDYVMRLFICVGNMAWDLSLYDRIISEGERNGMLIAGLHREFFEIYRPSVDSWTCSCLEPAHFEAEVY
jgi:hypothetical protein